MPTNKSKSKPTQQKTKSPSKRNTKTNSSSPEEQSSPFTIIIDTREQLPYTFPEHIPTIRKGLRTGDYSILGYEQYISIERKSKEDFYGSVTSGRVRFNKEIERLAQMRCPLVIIECSFLDLLTPPDFSQVNASSVANTLLSWQLKYRLPFSLIDGRRLSSLFVLRYLEKFWKHREKIVQGGSLNEYAKPFLP